MSTILPQKPEPQQLSFFDNGDGTSPFDKIKHRDIQGHEYWLARELMVVLDYKSWQFFEPVIKRAKVACKNANADPKNHFMRTHDDLPTNQGAVRKVANIKLSRYACYLIAINGDPSKPVIAQAQNYFVIQTRKQELAEENKALKRQQDVVAYQNKGKTEAWSEVRVDSKESQKSLNAALYATHEDHAPNFGAIGAIQNKELLGMTKREIIDYLGLLPKEEPNYRDRLGQYALDALRQVNMASAGHMKRLGRTLTDSEQQEVVRQVIRIVAPTMRDLAAFAGEDFLSGSEVDANGKPLIARNVRLLKDGN